MKELLLSDITLMGPGYCVLGLSAGPGPIQSLRPMPGSAFAWREPFEHKRGDWVRVEFLDRLGRPPHVEDRRSWGMTATDRSVTEDVLVQHLKKAEVAGDIQGLFQCQVRSSPKGGQAVWVDPKEARRSICGCEFRNIRLRLFKEADRFTMRAQLLLPSGEALQSLPLVDRDWNWFARKILETRTFRRPRNC